MLPWLLAISVLGTSGLYIGLMAIKGLDLAEIAAVRGAAQGTVRAQLTRIYAKAGVSGRAQFAAYFVEDLLGQGVAA